LQRVFICDNFEKSFFFPTKREFPEILEGLHLLGGFLRETPRRYGTYPSSKSRNNSTKVRLINKI
jgi:hypothetical protein